MSLPVEEVIDEVRHALGAHGSAVLVAPPGSGKTTLVPLRLLDVVDGKLVVLEPRRIATRAAARRMAQMLGEGVGETVGYVTRHDRALSRATRIEVITEGVLTRRLQSDPTLAGTGLVIFDEVHERNLQTDLGLALTIDARLALRPDLWVLAMSATIDAGAIASMLGGSPVISASARTHPVEIRWVPPPPRSRQLADQVARVVRRALDHDQGDVLVFLPGMAEIRRVSERLIDVPADVRLLHGSIPPADQDAAIAPSAPPFPKVVLATDIAESSITVEGIGVVIDSGLARAPRFDPHTGMTRLQTIAISRASADQRAGRAGRLGPGVAYRLWSKIEHGTRPPHIEPEITQVDLAGLALELAAWGVSDPGELTWLDSPPAPAWSEAIDLLAQLGAVTEGGRITELGRQMERLPLHPRLAHMVATAGEDAALAVWLAALLSERDPLRGRPGDVTVDVGTRVRLLIDDSTHHPAASPPTLRRIRRVAADLAQRAGIGDLGRVHTGTVGRVLALAYPDRLAIRRGSPGRFQLRTGTTCFMSPSEALAAETFLVAADLDGRRKDARIRLAAGIDQADVLDRFSHQIRTRRSLTWEGDRLVDRTESRLGGIVLERHDQRPEPGVEVATALTRRVRERGIEALPWSRGALALRERVNYLHGSVGGEWPDWSDSALRRSVDDWLAPHLVTASGWDDVQDLDMAGVLQSMLGYELRPLLDRMAPTHILVPSGRRVRVDYGRDHPTVSVRVQEMFGSDETPRVGGEPVVLELLSPANRPLQITSDLAGFWRGSWSDVRKEMAGRYPKHPWPEDPASAQP